MPMMVSDLYGCRVDWLWRMLLLSKTVKQCILVMPEFVFVVQMSDTDLTQFGSIGVVVYASVMSCSGRGKDLNLGAVLKQLLMDR